MKIFSLYILNLFLRSGKFLISFMKIRKKMKK
ncbi:MAG: hypothetical protein QG670_655 [Thermoproteota archaeon]|nr:hypothetical protein [Thermoproteota archaeon]